MSPDLARGVITQATGMGVRYFVIAGGEPTLHPQLVQILEHARSAGRSVVQLVTNGTQASPEFWRTVLPLVDDVQLSVDATDAATNDGIRGTGAFAGAMRLLRQMHEEFPSVRRGISFTPQAETLGQMPDLHRFAMRIGAKYVHLNRPKRPKSAEGQLVRQWEAFHSVGMYERALRAYDELLLRHSADRQSMTGLRGTVLPELDTSFDPGTNILRRFRARRCAAGIATMCVDEVGNGYPCASLAGGDSCGNVREVGLEAVYAAVRRQSESAFDVDRCTECAHCEYRYFCGGGCRALTGPANGRDLACAVFKKRFLKILGGVGRQTARAPDTGDRRPDCGEADVECPRC